jgi:hypothetical protein
MENQDYNIFDDDYIYEAPGAHHPAFKTRLYTVLESGESYAAGFNVEYAVAVFGEDLEDVILDTWHQGYLCMVLDENGDHVSTSFAHPKCSCGGSYGFDDNVGRTICGNCMRCILSDHPDYPYTPESWVDSMSCNRDAEVARWQVDGLMPESSKGALVWKVLTKDMCGMLQFQYQFQQEFQCPDAMACAGPWGAVKEYGMEGMYLAAVRAQVLPVHARPGVFYTPRGTVTALYTISELDSEGFLPVLVDGPDEMQEITGIPSKKAIS